jgi:hypothetical protein
MSSIKLKGSTSGDITISAPAVAGTNTISLPAETGSVLTNSTSGTILQVKQTIDTAVSTITNTGSAATFVDHGSLSVTITPTSTTNKILLFATMSASGNTADRLAFYKFTGGNTASGVGASAGSRSRCLQAVYFPGTAELMSVNMHYLDSPSTTSAVTYKVQVAPNFSSGNLAINYYFANDADNVYIPRTASTITAIEVVA